MEYARSRGDVDAVELNEDFAVDRAKEIETETGDRKRAEGWYDIATAKTPLLSELLDKWLDGERYKEATKKQHRAAFRGLKEFLGGDRLPAAVTMSAATNFVEDWIRKSGRSYNTQRRKLNSLVGFWKWMGLRHYVDRGFNPWTGFTLSKLRTPKKTPDKRPYTDEELIRLFSTAPAYEGLAAVMVLGLYTGARLDELCALRMKDVEWKLEAFFLTLRTGKGKTQTRTIAVAHPSASSVMAGLWSAHSDPAEQLFPSFKAGGYDGKLSWSVSKAFGRFRDSVGLPRGVDFHSFRRTLITTMENLEIDQVTIARYVGHTLPTLAFALYSGGPTEKTSRAVAERIKYSPEVEQVVAGFRAK